MLNIILDTDGVGLDSIELEKFKLDLKTAMHKQFQYFVSLDKFKSLDSKDNLLIQIADLYASALNNIYSDLPITSENAKCRKDFAKLFIEQVGIDNIENTRGNKKNKVSFINKYINNFS